MKGWRRYTDLLIPAAAFDDALLDYPALITHQATGFPAAIFDHAAIDGSDLRATIAGMRVPLHVAGWDAIAETCQLWVQLPVASGDVVVRLWFDNPNADPVLPADPYGQYAVWVGFAGVWGLEEQGNGTAGEYKDWTGNGHHGQGGDGDPTKVPTRAAGVVGQSQGFSEDWITTVDEPLRIPGAMTIGCWFRQSAYSLARICGKLSDSRGPYLQANATGLTGLGVWSGGTQITVNGATSPLLNLWHYTSATYSPSVAMRIYLDGVEDGSRTTGVPASQDVGVGVPWRIGVRGDTANPYAGDLDHVTLSPTARSLAWHAADYRLQGTQSLVVAGEIQRAVTIHPARLRRRRRMTGAR